jgi:hypothetical protein
MRPLALALLALLSVEAVACGICIDDKVASAYDHAVVAKAKARGHAVAFFAIDGSLPRGAEVRAQVLSAVQGTPGVRRGTARVSLENAALSFAYDPRRAEQSLIVSGIEKKLYARGLSLRFLRVMP